MAFPPQIMAGGDVTSNWIAPFGTIFINLLKLIAMPLVLSSLITGVASLSVIKKLSRIGGKTIYENKNCNILKKLHIKNN